MPRKPRNISSTGIYHIILRSVNQHIIFEEESDYRKFLLILSDCKTQYNIDIYAYCLMDNHIHLLLFSQPDSLAKFFRSLGSKFVRWYNNKYSRSGHLFQDRFHSTTIENNAQYLTVLNYIHNNPVKARICRFASEYRWSSFNAFYGEKNPLINKSFSYDIAGSKDLLLNYFAMNLSLSEEELYQKDHPQPAHYLSDNDALELFKEITGLTSTSEAGELNKVTRNKYIRMLKDSILTNKQIARFMDISVTTVKRL